MSRRWIGLLAALVVMAASSCSQPYQPRGTAFPTPLATPQFTLTSETGEPLRLADLQGKVVLLFFGYTTCPDYCPTSLAEARQILDDLGEQADQVAVLLITVDPERDTPERLASYTDGFHPGIVGVTGAASDLQAVYDAFLVRAEREEMPDSALGYLVNHTTRTYLVNQQGELALSYGYDAPPEDILADVRQLLNHH